MACMHSLAALFPIFCHLLLFLINNPALIFCQQPSSSTSNATRCSSRFLPLLPCTPFVQGTALSPGQQCCDGLSQLYSQVPDCLCLLLNDTSLSSFPLNRTLALQLPSLCNLDVNISACEGVHLPPTPPASFRRKHIPNSTVAASPEVQVAPTRPNSNGMMGLGFGIGRSEATHLKAGIGFPALILTVTLLYTLSLLSC